MKRLSLIAVVGLSACGTPQQQCISAATYDMRVVDGLIAESEANLARGYAYQDSINYIPQWQLCSWGGYGGYGGLGTGVGSQMCWVDQPVTVQRPVAIDLASERAKLKGLKAKRAQQATAAAAALAQCQATYPQ